MLNWVNLVTKGRAKDHGVPWNEEELHAIHELGIPFEYVRTGILTEEAYEKALAKDSKSGKPADRQKREELEATAKDLGVEFSPETTDAALVKLITKAQEAAANTGNDPEAPALPPREELEATAKDLGIKVTANMKDETVAAKIEEAKKANS